MKSNDHLYKCKVKTHKNNLKLRDKCLLDGPGGVSNIQSWMIQDMGHPHDQGFLFSHTSKWVWII